MTPGSAHPGDERDAGSASVHPHTPSRWRAGPSVRRAARVLVSVAVLALLALVVDPGDVFGRLSGMRPGWVVVGLALSVVQVVVSAWRWRFTAGRLGIDLRIGAAVREYYLATFLNQALPGGVLGDVGRAWRHAGSVNGGKASSLGSVHAVILERASGQAVMVGVAVVAAGALLAPGGPGIALLPRRPLAGVPATVWAPALLLLAFVSGWLLRRSLHRFARTPTLRRFGADARAALLGPALPVQAAVSLAIVASYVAVFVAAARAVGVETSTGALLPLIPPVLVAMLLPVSVAGWGVREGAAAVLWGSVGLAPADGVAISVAYGLLALVSSLPGAGVLALRPRTTSARARTGGRRRGGSDGSVAGSPRRASRSAEG